MKEARSYLTHPKYRADIDGLRAIAVLSVVAFHAFPDYLPGGFIGVDVFFVISGFLISTIIFDSLEKGAFNFYEFYSRRIARIFPALITVLVACYAVGWFRLLTEEYMQLGKHLVGGAAFISNFILWNETGYFDNAAITKPLLHLWSLGIEEQFYIIWPLLLWVAWKLRFSFITVTFVSMVLSFVMNNLTVSSDIVAAFYSPQTRFWELQCGSLLAWVTLYKKELITSMSNKIDARLRLIIPTQAVDVKTIALNVMSSLGMLLIAYSAYRITKAEHFPGTWALLPTLGALLIILAGSSAWLNRVVLSNRNLVSIGLISFPLYLWHWPLLSFMHITGGTPPTTGLLIGAVVISIILAQLTYVLIEKPIRFGKQGIVKVSTLVAIMISIGHIGYYTYSRNGFAHRFETLAPGHAGELLKIGRARSYRDDPNSRNILYVDPQYKYGAVGNNKKNKVLFVGDSHAFHYRATVAHLLEKGGYLDDYSVIFPTISMPLSLAPEMVADDSIKTVVISMFWALQYGSKKVHQSNRLAGRGKNSQSILNTNEMDQYDLALKNTVQLIRNSGKKVYFILDNPFGEELDPYSMIKRDAIHGIKFTAPTVLYRQNALARAEPIRSRIIKIAQETKSKIIDPFEFLCNNNTCPAFSADGEFLYNDYDHLSYNASIKHVNYLDEIFTTTSPATGN